MLRLMPKILWQVLQMIVWIQSNQKSWKNSCKKNFVKSHFKSDLFLVDFETNVQCTSAKDTKHEKVQIKNIWNWKKDNLSEDILFFVLTKTAIIITKKINEPIVSGLEQKLSLYWVYSSAFVTYIVTHNVSRNSKIEMSINKAI